MRPDKAGQTELGTDKEGAHTAQCAGRARLLAHQALPKLGTQIGTLFAKIERETLQTTADRIANEKNMRARPME
jgi:hypothetical protein